jgi:NADPH:quinone reductase-like Zn-dependent oxidoreductase
VQAARSGCFEHRNRKFTEDRASEEDQMPKAIRFYQPGGPEVLMWEEVKVGKPGSGEARVRHTAVGLNYVDVYIRKGLSRAIAQRPRHRGSRSAMAKHLFAVVLSGLVKIEINQSYLLKEAAQAHRDLEARKTTGSTVFTV